MKIYIIGSNGQLGSEIYKILSKTYKIEGGGRDKFNIKHVDDFIDYIKNRYNIVINCAAFHNVPLCEKNSEEAFLMNSFIPGKIAEFTKKYKIKFIHFSTDYVFDGKKNIPYIETDMPNPLNIYGMSKYDGEKRIISKNDNATILRVSGLYGKNVSRVKGYNFVSKVIELGKKEDEINMVKNEILTPTYTKNIAVQMKTIIKNDIKGIVHCTDNGEVSWYDFANEILKMTKINCKLNPIDQNNTTVKRPKYSVLNNKILNDAGIEKMKYWKEALFEYLNEL